MFVKSKFQSKIDYVARELREQRTKSNLTQKEVAEELGIPYQDYQKYEYGMIVPKKERYKKLCEILGIKITNIVYNFEKR